MAVDLGVQLERLGAARGMTLNQIATKLGKSPSQLYKWRDGQEIPATVVGMLAEKLNVSPLWFLTGQEPMFLDGPPVPTGDLQQRAAQSVRDLLVERMRARDYTDEEIEDPINGIDPGSEILDEITGHWDLTLAAARLAREKGWAVQTTTSVSHGAMLGDVRVLLDP